MMHMTLVAPNVRVPVPPLPGQPGGADIHGRDLGEGVRPVPPPVAGCGSHDTRDPAMGVPVTTLQAVQRAMAAAAEARLASLTLCSARGMYRVSVDPKISHGATFLGFSDTLDGCIYVP